LDERQQAAADWDGPVLSKGPFPMTKRRETDQNRKRGPKLDTWYNDSHNTDPKRRKEGRHQKITNVTRGMEGEKEHFQQGIQTL